jgi:hypothetical protein
MHDGEADEVMKEESPPKRERVLDGGDRHKGVDVYDGKIPSRLPRYAGPARPYDADGEDVAVGQSDRVHQASLRLEDSHTRRSIRGDRRSHGSTVVDEVAPSESNGEEAWTF